MAEINQIRKLHIVARPEGKDSTEALSIIRRDAERTYAEDPFGIATNKNKSSRPQRRRIC